jgi:hypothetical protein
MKVFLVFLPPWTQAMAHLAWPLLTAYLRGRGMEVTQRDLNRDTFDALLSHAYLEQAIERLHGELKSMRRGDLPEKIRWALEKGAGLAATAIFARFPT